MVQMYNYQTLHEDVDATHRPTESAIGNNSVDDDNDNDKRNDFRKFDVAVTVACIASSFSVAMSSYSLGAFLPDILQITNSTPGDSWYIVVPISAGSFVGSVAARFLISFSANNLVMFFLTLARAFTLAVIPLFTTIQVTGCFFFLHNLSVGASEVVTIFIMSLLGGDSYRSQFVLLESSSRAFGAAVGILVLDPFLSKQETTPGNDPIPFKLNDSYLRNSSLEHTTHWTHSHLLWGCLIIAGVSCVPGILFAVLHIYNQEQRKHGEENCSHQTSIKLSDFMCNAPLLMSFLVYFLFVCLWFGIYFAYESLLTIFCVESELRLSKGEGVLMTIFFWVSIGMGRITIIPFFKCLPPFHIACFDMIVVTAFLIALSVFGQQSSELLWIGTVFIGLFLGTAGPSILSWALFNIASDPVTVTCFGIGINIGIVVLEPWIGKLMDSVGPQCMFYGLVGGSLATLLCLAILPKLGKWASQEKIQKSSRESTELTRINANQTTGEIK